ncbi:MAG: hypothetical protein JWO10_1594 [Microbacteriaceae bacterium]|nr:hypothetical protein [Microbacteriaceae bacterium]
MDQTPAPASAPSEIPQGWYPDEQRPGFERWWNGLIWSSATHKAPRWSGNYERSYWPGMNASARTGLLVGRFALAAAFVPRFVALLLPEDGDIQVALAIIAGFATLALILAAVAISYAVKGLKSAPIYGGRGAAGWAIGFSGLATLWALSQLAFVIALH